MRKEGDEVSFEVHCVSGMYGISVIYGEYGVYGPYGLEDIDAATV